ncbi:MAG: branched-chain amino acid ABC transporter permease [Rhodospirillales bacterium]
MTGNLRLPLLILFVLGLAAPFLLYPIFLMKVLCFALFACAYNLLIGYVGLISFGHAAFFGIAAYVTGHAAKVWGFPTELAILAGTLAATILGGVFGWLAIRRQGIYFAMVTLALAQMVYFFCLQAPFTHGEDGIQAIPRGTLLGMLDLNNQFILYYFVFFVFVLAFAILLRAINSPFGQVLTALRENEMRAVSLGYRADLYKLLAFVLSAAFSGLAGALITIVFQLAALNNVHWHLSGEVVLMTLMGGMGTVIGPIIGAFILVAIQNYFAQVGAWSTIIQGVIFVACVLVFRHGIVGEIERWRRRQAARQK